MSGRRGHGVGLARAGWLLAPALLLAGCGEPPAAVLAARVRVDAAYTDDVKKLTLFAFGPRLTDGTFLPCTSMMARSVRPDDPRVDRLGRLDLTWPSPGGPSATLANVASGDGRVVYVAAYDLHDSLILHGCADGVSVEEGETTVVVIDLYVL